MQRPRFSQSPKRVGSGPSRPPISIGGTACDASDFSDAWRAAIWETGIADDVTFSPGFSAAGDRSKWLRGIPASLPEGVGTRNLRRYLKSRWVVSDLANEARFCP